MALCSIGPRQITGASSWVRKPIETTWRPYFSAGPDLLAVGLELRLQAEHDRHVRAVDVAVEDADAAPIFASAMARLTATVVLPTPPLPAPTAMTFFTPGSGGLPCSGADTDLHHERSS